MKRFGRVMLLAALALLVLAPTQWVNAAPPAAGCNGTPTIQYAYANPPVINAGQATTLQWGLIGNADAAYLLYPNGHRIGIGTPGSQQVNPQQNSTYYVQGYCGGNMAQQAVQVTVNNSPGCNGAPQITSFNANPTNIQRGQSSTLSWGPVNNAQYVQLSSQNEGGSGVPAPGSVQVQPNQTTTYYLTAWCQSNSVQQQVTVNVSGAPPTPPPPSGSQITGITYNGSLSNSNTTIITANYYWDGQDPPAVMQGTAYNGNGALVSTSNATRINANQNFYANLNFRINPNQVSRVNVCIIGNSGTELVCQNGSK